VALAGYYFVDLPLYAYMYVHISACSLCSSTPWLRES